MVPYLHFRASLVALGFPGDSDGRDSVHNWGDPGSIPRSGRSPGERNDHPLLPAELHGQRVSYSPQGRKESDMTEQLASFYTYNEENNKRQTRSLYYLLLTGIGFAIVERTFNIVEKPLN